MWAPGSKVQGCRCGCVSYATVMRHHSTKCSERQANRGLGFGLHEARGRDRAILTLRVKDKVMLT